jgi:hypothetical protein
MAINPARGTLYILTFAFALSACRAGYPVRPDEQVVPQAKVTVTFPEPRDLEARRGSTVYRLAAIRRVHGRVDEVRSDTLVLRIEALVSRSRQPRLPRGAQLHIVRDNIAQLSERRLSTSRTAGLMFGASLMLLVVIGLATMDLSGGTCTTC